MENILGGAIWIGFAFLLFWVVGKFKVKEGGRVDRFTEKLSLVFLFLGVLLIFVGLLEGCDALFGGGDDDYDRLPTRANP